LSDEKETVIAISNNAILRRPPQETINEANNGCRTQDYIDDLVFAINQRQAAFFKNILENYCIESILDLSCGNGDLAVLLAGWNKDVTTLRQDSAQVDKVNLKSVLAGVHMTVSHGDIRDLSSIYKERFNLITCFHNSLPRLANEADIWGTLAQIYLRLEPGGILLIQTLNYDYLLNGNKDILSALKGYYGKLGINVSFNRGQDKAPAGLVFKVLVSSGGRKEKEFIVPIRPICQRELNIWLAELGYEKIENYGANNKNSKNLETWEVITMAFRPFSTGHD
jgi:glycine/sarcosine N-methyltransferase